MRTAVLCSLFLLLPTAMQAVSGIPPQRLGHIDCRITGSEPVIRAEATTDVAGPATLTCTNEDVPDTGEFEQYFNADITARVGSVDEGAQVPSFTEGLVNVTNRISYGLGTGISDAVLVIGGNDAANAKATSVFAGPGELYPLPQVGALTSANVLFWDDVQLPIPGAPHDTANPPAFCSSFDDDDPTGCFPATITFQIKNIRVTGLFDEVNTVSVQKIAVRAGIAGSPAVRVLDASGGEGAMADVVNIADPEQGIFTTVSGNMSSAEICHGEMRNITVHLAEGYASAFKLLGVAGFVQTDASGESGYPVRTDGGTSLSGIDGGGADGPTRFILRFSGIPFGVTVSVSGEVNNGSAVVDGDGLWVRRVAGANASGGGGTVTTTGAVVSVQAGFGSATYELIDGNPAALESISIPLQISWASDGPVAASILGIEGTLAPASADRTASATARIPRFTNLVEDRARFTLQACPNNGICTFGDLGSTMAYFDASSGVVNFGVSASHPSCIWGAEEGEFTTAAGNLARLGTDTILYQVAANMTGVERVDAFTQAGLPRTVIQRATNQTFADVPPDKTFFDPINRIRARGITDGCGTGPLIYCDTDVITRGQMAVFIVRSIFGGDTFFYPTDAIFDDVDAGHPFFKWIQKMAELGITNGCGPSTYCPGDSVTRGQMAVFIIRMRFGAATDFSFPAIPAFGDVPSNHLFFKWIQKMAEIGVTTGCAVDKYCGGNPVLRDQMAVFILRGGFNEFLDAPHNITLASTLTPASGMQGEMVTVRLESTELFPAGVPAVTPVDGITPGAVLLPETNVIEIDLMIAADAELGPRSLNLVFGGAEITFPNAFTVLSAAP